MKITKNLPYVALCKGILSLSLSAMFVGQVRQDHHLLREIPNLIQILGGLIALTGLNIVNQSHSNADIKIIYV